ncbi:MAG TPA: DUF1570 domain-containing protein [Candidatus Sulfotelmatobacter sp.]|nr:DUF1570 domain-containing protein [Candidatus Sulfotelmatobacter sp.]
MSKYLLLLLPLLGASFATAREHPANWIEVRSSRFTIVTNSNEKQGRHIAAQFERMRAILQQTYPQLEDDPESPVFVFAITTKDQFRALEPGTYHSRKSLPLHGMFVGATDKNYILMRLDSEAGNPYPVVYHEYTHLFFHQAEERMPLWLNEGLAEFYQTSEIYGQNILLGEPDQQRLMLLRQETLLPFATLLTVDEKSPYYIEEKKGAIFYAECWALTHYLTLRDYAEKTSKVQQYKRQVKDGVDPVTAATRVFGDLQKLQRSLELYIEQSSFNHFETKLSDKVNESLFEVQPISPAQVHAMEADFLVASGRGEEARALFPSVKSNDISPLENTDLVQPAQRKQADEKFPNEVQGDVPCPLSEILQRASERAAELVDNLQRFTATEEIEQTEFRRNGKPRKATNQLFSYLAEIAQVPSGGFWVEEYRSSKKEADSSPVYDTGTAAFALIFHPQKVVNFEFRCEGRMDLQGISAWQLRFVESPDPSKSFHQIRIQRSVYQLRFGGRAWIAANDYQILRLETDLVAPLPQIRLQLEHLDISYAPVEFDKRKFSVWLPQKASIQISYRGRRYERLHKFSHFQLFLVVTEQTVKVPTAGPGG